MVSGIITTYKRDASVVRRAIDSMLAQTCPVSEIILVDDNENGSPYSQALAEMCAGMEKVRCIKQDGNRGACAARNLGIENARGEYIAFLDDDDIWLPEKIEKQLRRLEKEGPSVGMVFCCGIVRDESTGKEADYYTREIFRERPSYQDMLYYDYAGTTSGPLIRKACFEKVGGFWEAQPARQDYEMWIRISKEYGLVGIPENLFVHTIHPDEQISKGMRKNHIGHVNIYERYKKDIDAVPMLRKQRLHCIVETGVKSLAPDTLRYIIPWLRTSISRR